MIGWWQPNKEQPPRREALKAHIGMSRKWSLVLKITPTPSDKRPALIYYQFVFELGLHETEEQARECWESLGFTLPQEGRSVDLIFSSEELKYGE